MTCLGAGAVDFVAVFAGGAVVGGVLGLAAAAVLPWLDRLAAVALSLALAYGSFVLADEVLTPDSSRFWPAELWEPGHPQPSYDKQFVRDWLTSAESGWNRRSGDAPPELPSHVVEQTRAKYVEAYERLTGETF